MVKVRDVLKPGDLGFDPDALRERYRRERDKRWREDTEQQFIAVTPSGEHAEYLLEDPFTPVPAPREPVIDQVEVAIIGGGWVGLMVAARLSQMGVDDVRIIDAAADFGGTWYWNRYPGAQCDIESYSYLPLLEETGYIPKERYSYAPEIFEHAQRIGKQFGLYDKAMFQTWVTEARWDDEAGVWLVGTDRGDRMRARFLAVCTGPASRPRLPGIPGIEEFAGRSFHTCRWDYQYTGGGPDGGLSKLGDKKVAVIGTGATGIQCIPKVGESAQHLYVFQRTPSSVDQRNNEPTDMEWAKSLKPGWQRRRMDAFNAAILGRGPVEGPDGSFSSDRWTLSISNVRALAEKVDPGTLDPGELEEFLEYADFQSMEQIRRRVDETVHDPEVADRLKAWYRRMCKRPTFNDEYLPTFNRPNVTLVDVSESKGVERITKKGLVVNGVEYEVDCIIYASGFEITSDFQRRIGIPIFGRRGKSLYDHWRTGMRALHAHSSHGFPNMFVVGGLFPFSFGANYCSIVDDQAEHVAYIMREIIARGARRVEVTQKAEDDWVEAQLNSSGGIAKNLGGQDNSCTPGYFNQEGNTVKTRNWKQEQYWGSVTEFATLLKEWQEEGNLAGLELR